MDIDNRGGVDEFLIGAVQDVDLAQFISSPEIVEIQRSEAETFFGEDIDLSIVKILRPDEVMEVLMKQARGESLSQKEKESIDPDKSTRLVARTKTLRQRLDDFGV